MALLGRTAEPLVQQEFAAMIKADMAKVETLFGDNFKRWVNEANPLKRQEMLQKAEPQIKLFQEYKYELDLVGDKSSGLAERFRTLANDESLSATAKAQQMETLKEELTLYRQETTREAVSYLYDNVNFGEGATGLAGREKFTAALKVMGETSEGAELLRQVVELEKRIPGSANKLVMEFVENHPAGWGGYEGTPTPNRLGLDATLSQMPSELVAPILAHELSHRLRRWENATLQNEVLSHEMGAKVWQELLSQERHFDLSHISDLKVRQSAETLFQLNNEVLEQSQDSSVDFSQYVRERGYQHLAVKPRTLLYEHGDEAWVIEHYRNLYEKYGD